MGDFEAAASDAAESLNLGLLRFVDGRAVGAFERTRGPATLIVSGIARGGTSMAAQALQRAGVFMGELVDDIVFEDIEFGALIEGGDLAGLDTAIARRDRVHRRWGFKRPNLFETLAPEQLRRFRAPRLVLMVRDPVAIAQRNVIANLDDAAVALQEATERFSRLVGFALAAPCPVLLASYEKAVLFPEAFVDALLSLAGLQPEPARRLDALRGIAANSETYRSGALLRFEGHLDGVFDGWLTGWCCYRDRADPVVLDLLIDGAVVASTLADVYRPDVEAAGFHQGRHGFAFSLEGLDPGLRSVAVVQPQGKRYTLPNSGRTLAELAGRGSGFG